MATVEYESEGLNDMTMEKIESKTDAGEIAQNKNEPFEMVEVKMEPIDPEIELKEFQESDKGSTFVCDGIFKKEVLKKDSAEENVDIQSTSEEVDVVKMEYSMNPDDVFNDELEEQLMSNNQSEVKHTTVERRFKCAHCDYECKYKGSLVIHLRVHTGEKPFTCKMCDFKCSQKSILETHVRRHTGEKPFSCNYCDYKCAQKTHLMRHEQTHTGEKSFQCDLCSYSSSQKNNLIRHKRTHTGEKSFSCVLCDFKTSQKASLETHIRAHTGEKPFKCPYCHYGTGDKSNLKSHIKRKHKQLYENS